MFKAPEKYPNSPILLKKIQGTKRLCKFYKVHAASAHSKKSSLPFLLLFAIFHLHFENRKKKTIYDN